jgi:hypothetical protein
VAGWGSVLEQAYDGATETAKDAANWVGSTVSAASQQIAALASAAYDKTVELAKVAAAAGILGSEYAAVAGVKGAGMALGAAGSALTPLADKAAQAYQAVKEKFFPKKPALIPCMPCLAKDTAAARAARIDKRNQLIAKARASNDPAAQAKANQLQQDMAAVEMARLSANTYTQYDPNASPEDKEPPQPWHAMTDGELQAAGIDPNLVHDSKAVIYTLPPDFPYNPKTVLAFRGTTSEDEDILADHDQALGMETQQYSAAISLGQEVGDAMPGAEVTGHSLGGGKAQAAGIAGGLQGMMFNSAGLNPQTVGMTPDDLAQHQDQFVQYRASGGIMQGGGDPLTGVQNSPLAQDAAYGTARVAQGALNADAWARQVLGQPPLTAGAPQVVKDLASRVQNVTTEQAAKNYALSKGKWYIPPAVGEVRGVTSKTDDGSNAGILGAQHSITNMVDGFEMRKYSNISDLLAATKTQGNPADYLGPSQVVMQ